MGAFRPFRVLNSALESARRGELGTVLALRQDAVLSAHELLPCSLDTCARSCAWRASPNDGRVERAFCHKKRIEESSGEGGGGGLGLTSTPHRRSAPRTRLCLELGRALLSLSIKSTCLQRAQRERAGEARRVTARRGQRALEM